jgi:hypothetical protein
VARSLIWISIKARHLGLAFAVHRERVVCNTKLPCAGAVLTSCFTAVVKKLPHEVGVSFDVPLLSEAIEVNDPFIPWLF